MTLSEHQGHPNWNQTVELSHVQHHTKFETNQFTSVPTQENVNRIFTWVGVKNFGFTEEQKNIEQGSIKLKELHVCIMRVQKKMAAWQSSAIKCRKAIFAYVAKRKSSSCTFYVC